MKNIYDTINSNPLFFGISKEDFKSAQKILCAKKAFYKKDTAIIKTDEKCMETGVLIKGNAKIIKEDENGNISIISGLKENEIFGEVFAFSGIKKNPVTVIADTDCNVLLLNYSKIFSKNCVNQDIANQLIKNILKVLAKKAFMLNMKIEILSKRTTREKVLAFLNAYSNDNNKYIIVPYNREEMSDYLCVDRSALSAELCKMRNEGLIKFNKNKFEIL